MMVSLSDHRDEPNGETPMTAHRVVSLAFGLIVTLTGGAFIAVIGLASSLPSGVVA